ncbi:MAG: hypothetical protein O3C41_08535 [Bacteroidetes bacterium]|nr:hypothetical protein [Bacteroidota bacterium]MDA1177113.1 hypothetical protein [Bacteroidota bacterium]
MKNPPFYKKIAFFGLALFLISFPLFVVLETDYNKPFDLESDQGIVTLMFITSIVLMLVGFILSKIKGK